MQKAKFRIIVIRRFEFILSRRNVKKKKNDHGETQKELSFNKDIFFVVL